MHDRYGVFVGLDVGKEGHHAVALNREGKRLHDTTLPNAEAGLRRLFDKLGRHGRILLVVDQPASIGALPVAVARACGHQVAYLPGLVMRRLADLHPGTAKTDARDAYVIADAARTLPQALRAFGPEYKRWVDSRMPGDAEITPSRLRVLAVLARRSPMTMVALSRELGTTANNVTKLVDWLEAAGHLERRRDVHDRRAVELHLTHTGRDAEQRLAQAHADAVAEVFTDLPDEQLDQLTALLDRLRAAMRDLLA